MDAKSPNPADETVPALKISKGEVWFDRFVLKQVIGQGGMGVVWSARDQRLNEDVALKFLPAMLRWDAAAIAALREETQRTRRLSHPHIVRVYDLYEGEEGIALAMELVDGESLTSWRMRNPGGVVSPAEIEPWLAGLGEALDYAHGAGGIVHRDLKPANLLIDRSGQVKVADFGVSCLVAESVARVSSMVSGGTVPYMSPQQLWGEAASASDDVYALAATLYELLTGEPPFVRGNLLLQVPHKIPVRLNRRRKELRPEAEPVPDTWESAVMASLAKDVKSRPVSAGAFVQKLQETEDQNTNSHRGMRTAAWVLGGIGILSLIFIKFFDPNDAVSPTSTPFEAPTQADPEAVEVTQSALTSDEATTAVSTSRYVHGSLGRGMVGHWPLDRLLLDYCGGKRDAMGYQVEWVEDRFGGANLAARLRSRASMKMPLDSALNKENGVIGSIAMWVKSPRGIASLVSLSPDLDRALGIHARLELGRIYLEAQEHRHQTIASYSSEELMPDDQWFHLVISVEGDQMTLWLDGRKVIEGKISGFPGFNTDLRYSLDLGGAVTREAPNHEFSVDDVRVWDKPLDAAAVLTLAQENFRPMTKVIHATTITWPWDEGWSYRPTAQVYSDQLDSTTAVKGEFGEGAQVADWQAIAQAAGPWPDVWSELAMLNSDNGVMVFNRGSAKFEGARTYFMNRYTSGVPAYYLAHSVVGDGTLALGSWSGRVQPILARIPEQDRYQVRRWGPGHAPMGGSEIVWKDGKLVPLEMLPSRMKNRIDQRVWIIELDHRFIRAKALDLMLQDGLSVRIQTSSRMGTWTLSLQADGGAKIQQERVEIGAQSVTWIVIQSENRIYQAIFEQSNQDKIAELVTADWVLPVLPEESWALAIDAPSSNGPPEFLTNLTAVVRKASVAQNLTN